MPPPTIRRATHRGATALLGCVLLAAVVGCTGSAPGSVEPTGAATAVGTTPIHPPWREISLPFPPGSPGRISVRDATACDGHWFITGAVLGTDGSTRPAAWASTDGVTWTPFEFVFTADSYYGKRSLIYAATCWQGRLVAIGAKGGGAHGNPRVRTWAEVTPGTLREIHAGFEVYGGPNAVSAARVAGGPNGFLIAGSRLSGAAVWTSRDATAFRLREGVSELASDARGRTWAIDVVADPGGWTVVGGFTPAGEAGAEPMVWTSADGVAWHRVLVPAGGGFNELHRVVRTDSGLFAVGIRGSTFGAWRESAGTWGLAGAFGASGGPVAPGIDGLAVSGDLVLVAAHGVDGRRLWASTPAGDRWSPVDVPVRVPTDGTTTMALAAAAGRALLIADDGSSAHVWLVPLADLAL
jgi:hypothetical protein